MKKAVHFLLLAVVLAPAWPASAQLINQTLNLRQGWNAVFLEVDPEPANCDTLFAGKPIESIWFWSKKFTSVQFVQDPNSLLPGQPDWLTWLRPADPGRPGANLFFLQGGKAYLIKASAATTVSLRGRPVNRGAAWLAESFNLAGFYVSSNGPPNFQTMLAPSPAHVGQPIYRLSTTGTWQTVISASTTPVVRGESYWIRASKYSSYAGFLNVSFEQGDGLDFGRTLTEQVLRIRNSSSNSTTYTLTRLASAAPTTPNQPALAGDVPLSYWRMNLALGQAGFLPLPASLVSPSIPPGGEWSIRFAVRRADMNSFTLPAGYSTALYQSILRLTDTQGSESLLPVSSEGPERYAAASATRVPQLFDGSQPVNPRAGLWVGSAALKGVSQASVSQVPVAAASDFQFRVILHVDGAGAVRLLQNVIVAWTNGVAMTNEQGFREMVTPGRYALLTDASLISRFSGSSLRDGNVTGRRIASAAFSFRNPILASGSGNFGDADALVNCSVPLGFNDSLNPFTHRYHPDHNNLDERYETVREESPNITRQVSFRFTGQDPEQLSLPGWGDNQLGGVYSETISGLHKSPVKVEGVFRLYRASNVPALNDLNF